jgi:predicted SAM-dependent methyltransferase
MLRSLLESLAGPRVAKPGAPIRLHIGGQIAHADWKILDVRPGPHVDFVGHCTDLSAFADCSTLEIYASHVLEHLGYIKELSTALGEFYRVLAPGGRLRASVPDLDTLCTLFTDPALSLEERFHVMRMMFGGQTHPADFHYVGLNEGILRDCLQHAGFVDIVRIGDFKLFDDTSTLIFRDRPISLNLDARKPYSG